MKSFESNIVNISNSAEVVFNYLGDFSNFGKLMPEQITNWQATADTCSFTISGMATIGMRIQEKTPHTKIVIIPEGKQAFGFELLCVFKELDPQQCELQIVFNADLNPMYSMMASKPLQNFVNILASKIKEMFDQK